MHSRSCLNINLSLLAENFQKLRSICSQNEIIFMVKADAYGHGLLPIVNFAHKELGVKEFGCATLAEAIQLREEFFDCQFEVYVFSDVQLQNKESAEFYLNRRILPIISNIEDLKSILENPCFKFLPLCLKFNTGMNRLGLPYNDAEMIIDLLKKSSRKTIHHLMTHFSSASLPMDNNKRNLEQRDNFANLKKLFLDSGLNLEKTSISNSGAIEQKVGLEETHVRPGLMLYGPSSLLEQYSEKSCWDGKIISSLETYILDSFSVERGQPIGYGATPCPSNGVVSILAMGYGDGFSTHYVGAEVAHGGLSGKVFGRVNMDMLQVFFKDASLSREIASGNKIKLWSNDPAGLSKF